MILIGKVFFPVSTKGNLVPFTQGYTYKEFFLKAHKGEETSALSLFLFYRSWVDWMVQDGWISPKASRKTLSRIPQGGLVHMKQLWRLQPQCTRLQEHMSGVMSVKGRHCSTCSLEATERQSYRQHTQWLEQKKVSNKQTKKKKKLSTNQQLHQPKQ